MAFQSGAFQSSAFQGEEAQAAVLGGGGFVAHIATRRKTEDEVRRERIRLGIIPAPVEKIVAKAAARLVKRAEARQDADPLEMLRQEHERYESQLAQMLAQQDLQFQQRYMVLLGLEIARVVQDREDGQIVELLMSM